MHFDFLGLLRSLLPSPSRQCPAPGPVALALLLAGITPAVAAAALVPGCGFHLTDGVSCWRETKAGPESVPRCATAILSSDPWAVSSASTGLPYRSYPRWDLPEVLTAGNLRYGWGNPRPAGYWPLGGPADEPWAESLPTLAANLRWACENYQALPDSLKRFMGNPAIVDMEYHEGELYDLVFLGGARDLNELIKATRSSGSLAETGCAPDSTTLCLGEGRFRVTVSWQDHAARTGLGNVSPLTDDTGSLWFFSSANVELVIKVLDGCIENGHFWVFASGLTDVWVEIKVEDTITAAVRTYETVPGTPFQPIQDTTAFDACF